MSKILPFFQKKSVIFIQSKWFKVVFFIFVVIAVVYQVKSFGNLGEFNFFKINLKKILFSFLFVFLTYLLHFLNWLFILRELEQDYVPFSKGLVIYFYSNLSRYLPGSYWYLFSRTAMGIKFGFSSINCLLSTGLELLIKVSSGLLIGVIGLFLAYQNLDSKQIAWLFIWGGGGTLFFCLFILLDKKYGVKDKQGKLSQVISSIRDIPLTLFVKLIIVYLFAWLSQAIALFFLLSNYIDIKIIDLGLVLIAYSVGWVLGFLNPLTPSGLGFRETIMIAILIPVSPASFVLLASLILRILSFITELLFASLGINTYRTIMGS